MYRSYKAIKNEVNVEKKIKKTCLLRHLPLFTFGNSIIWPFGKGFWIDATGLGVGGLVVARVVAGGGEQFWEKKNSKE